MKIVGNQNERKLQYIASGDALIEAAAFNERMQDAMPFGRVGYIPKGVYRFKSHEEANRQQDDALAAHMARIAMARQASKKTVELLPVVFTNHTKAQGD